MTLTLQITNMTTLPDGGSTRYSCTEGRFEIGRDGGMDWTLPDPNRFVSSCHAEVRWENGAYWLYDVSTNGTFVNGASMRVKSPYQLQNGDKIQFGHYIVEVSVQSAGSAGRPAPGSAFGADSPFPATPTQDDQFAGQDDPFGSAIPQDPYANSPDDLWSVPGVPAADPMAFGNNVPPPSGGDSAAELIPMDFDGASKAGSSDSPFGTPQQAAPSAAQPFGASPFGDTAQPSPPSGIPAPLGPQGMPAASPASEAFGTAAGTSNQVDAQKTGPAGAAKAPASDSAVLKAICEGAGVSPDVLAGVDASAAGYEIGQALRIVAAELASLLRVRSEGKQRYEKSSRTMIGRDDNNPLKFIPTANEALAVMFGPARQGYLRGPATMQSSFDDIKHHQYAVQAALQPALARLLEDLSPEAIEDKVGAGRFSSKSAKAWDLFVERWDAKTHPYENGMLDVFQAYFSDAYNDASNGK